MADHDLHNTQHEDEDDEAMMLDPDEAEEVVEQEDDAAMDSGDDDEDDEDGNLQEIQLQNDSVAHFDQHTNSIFCIAQHPSRPELVATGGGDDIGYLWDATPEDGPVLPRSYESDPAQPRERKGLEVLARLEEQDESVNAICFTLPKGEFVITGTLDGKMNAYTTPATTANGAKAQLVGSPKEVQEINWIAPCPNPAEPNTIAFGAGDGSVWVYNVSKDEGLTIVQTFFLHQAPCTAGGWTPDGKLLATVSEDSSLYVWDVFGAAATAGLADPNGSQAIIGLTSADERFKVDGGLYSLAISPGGGIVATGGAGGNVRVVGLPRLSVPNANAAAAASKGGRAKAGGAKNATSSSAASAGQSGQLLAAFQAGSDGIETLDFSQPPLTLLAAGSVDGSIVIFDAAHNFAVRRNIPAAHEEEAVIQVSFVKTPIGTPNDKVWTLTSCGNDGAVRRWDVRGGTNDAAVASKGLVGEWKGHRGGGEGGGVLGFVQGGGGRMVVTAGDDGVGLVFDCAKS
nr:putative wd repeat-containing protein c25h1.08c [Quercus suber]